MTPEAWVAIGIFAATQIVTWVAIVVALRGDAKSLKEQVSEMKEELKKLTGLIVMQTLQNERLRVIEERQMLSGKRLDDLTGRLNRFLDIVAFNTMDKSPEG